MTHLLRTTTTGREFVFVHDADPYTKYKLTADYDPTGGNLVRITLEVVITLATGTLGSYTAYVADFYEKSNSWNTLYIHPDVNVSFRND